MRRKQVLAMLMVSVMALGMTACGGEKLIKVIRKVKILTAVESRKLPLHFGMMVQTWKRMLCING